MVPKRTIVRDEDFIELADGVRPDAKKRIVLRKVDIPPGVSYRVYSNCLGQIVLDPQVSVPASEAWLFNNPEALESVRRGLSNARRGKTSKVDLGAL